MQKYCYLCGDVYEHRIHKGSKWYTSKRASCKEGKNENEMCYCSQCISIADLFCEYCEGPMQIGKLEFTSRFVK
jgi:hypothetical protein